MTVITKPGTTPADTFKKIGKRPEKEIRNVLRFPGMSPKQVNKALAGVKPKDLQKERQKLSEDAVKRAASGKPAIEEKEDDVVETATEAKAETATTDTKAESNGKPSVISKITGK